MNMGNVKNRSWSTFLPDLIIAIKAKLGHRLILQGRKRRRREPVIFEDNASFGLTSIKNDGTI